MSLRNLLSIAVLIQLFLVSCQPEPVLEERTSVGILEGSSVIIHGTFKKDQVVTSAEYIDVRVHLTEPGNYEVYSDTINGVYFRGSGSRADTGLVTVKLIAFGKPLAPGTNNFTLKFGLSACSASVVVTGDPASSNAVFTLGKFGENCTGTTITGVYMQGTIMTSLNTVKIDVSVTTPGTFTINTNTLNGVTFSATGNFSSPGNQLLTLYANGTPIGTGNFIYEVNAGTHTCKFPITYSSTSTPAVYTTGGSPGTCNPVTVNGTYKAGTGLNSVNTVVIQANVTTAGTYNISTGVVNGMSFAAAGLFTTPGLKTVILNGTGTPAAAGPNTFTLPGASGCSFTINTQSAGGSATGVITCKIDGVFTTFNIDATSFLAFPAAGWGQAIEISGKASATSTEKIALDINRLTNGTLIVPGDYGQGVSSSIAQIYYYTPAPSSFWYGISTTNPVKITITSISATNVKGTFTGKVYGDGGWSSTFKTITEGTFDVPVQ